MPFFVKGTALKQLSLLFSLSAASTELTESQLFACVYACCDMSWFEFCEELPYLMEEGHIVEVPRAFGQCLRLTKSGERALEMFQKSIPQSTRTAIETYMQENRLSLNREKQLVSSMEELPKGGQMVVLKALEGDRTIMEIRLSVASREQALQMRSRWKHAAEDIYAQIWGQLEQEDYEDKHEDNEDNEG